MVNDLSDNALTRFVAAPADPAARTAAVDAISRAASGLALLRQAEGTAWRIHEQARDRAHHASAESKAQCAEDLRQATDVAAELLVACARAYNAAGDRRSAEDCWLHAIQIVDFDLKDVDRLVRYRQLLRLEYLSWGHSHQASDMLERIACDLYAAGRYAESADTKIDIAARCIEANWLDRAIVILKDARATLRRAPGSHPLVLARLHTEDGIVHVRSGARVAGRNRLRTALAILEDPEQRDRVADQRAEQLARTVRHHLDQLAPRRTTSGASAGSPGTA